MRMSTRMSLTIQPILFTSLRLPRLKQAVSPMLPGLKRPLETDQVRFSATERDHVRESIEQGLAEMATSPKTALYFFSHALDAEEATDKPRPLYQIRCLSMMAHCRHLLKPFHESDTDAKTRLEQCESLLNRAYHLAMKAGMNDPEHPEHPMFLETMLWTAENYRWQGRADDAHTLYTAVRDSALNRGDTPMWLSSTVGLGHALLAQERDAEAVAMYNTMIGIAHRTGDWMNKGRAYLGWRKPRLTMSRRRCR
jgi:hypothetical protein